MDARLDGKRKLLHTLSQSLYLTPRSRAGVAPEQKEPEHDDDPMDKLLNEG
jgi:phage terminase small subunit